MVTGDAWASTLRQDRSPEAARRRGDPPAPSEGAALVEACSEAWGRAAIAAGTDPGEARAAARRTTAFYTGAEED
jgi:hypothetical protein